MVVFWRIYSEILMLRSAYSKWIPWIFMSIIDMLDGIVNAQYYSVKGWQHGRGLATLDGLRSNILRANRLNLMYSCQSDVLVTANEWGFWSSALVCVTFAALRGQQRCFRILSTRIWLSFPYFWCSDAGMWKNLGGGFPTGKRTHTKEARPGV